MMSSEFVHGEQKEKRQVGRRWRKAKLLEDTLCDTIITPTKVAAPRKTLLKMGTIRSIVCAEQVLRKPMCGGYYGNSIAHSTYKICVTLISPTIK